MGSRAITTPHHLTTVPLARLGTDEVGGGLFLAVCALGVGGPPVALALPLDAVGGFWTL